MEKEQDWIFTFGFGQGHDNCYTVFHGTYSSARDQMIRHFGQKWWFQYKSKEDAGVDKCNLTCINKNGAFVK